MLAIKLSKTGKTNKKMFRLIISEKSRDPYGNVLEILGSYNPHSKELVTKDDRIKYWLSKGAQMTASVNNLLVGKNIVEGKKVTASKPGAKSEKRSAQVKAKDDKKKAAEVVAQAPKEEVKAEEVPAAEPAAETATPEIVSETEAQA
ncbi:MAG TPA: 30S ribosomal protein S16 [Candidatus Saccharimonadales bacterium]|nr:30S ribosomal protein S16 [Candidatus Saccharimonadales bacterium]